ncbi:RRQRL motif-containing zinc-binding protein [Streptomyces sp. GS7]|uniref:RRQRL motif-containing zinc-binding protein n=1 Tax=Streptomyces sp. GS7 TaxID=2692234 RepID=UPI001F462EDD|nr:RRQRL motif-containing zinc-binding protein [Streptomyces sp. GS7]
MVSEFDRHNAPKDLLTRRQLRAAGLSPCGHDPVAQLRCHRCSYRPRIECTHLAWLYRADLAKPKRVPTLAQEGALDRAMAARQTCPKCKRRYYFYLPLRTQGCCDPCHQGFEPAPDTYTTSPAPALHRLAA